MNIKAILLDFDGTALQRDQVYLSIRNMKALQKAMDMGVEVIPSTGRVEDMFPPQIENDKRFRYWVTSNGARVVDRKTREVLYQSLFTPEESAEICRIFEGQGIYSEIAANGLIYIEKDINDHLEKYPVPPHHVWFVEDGRQIPVKKPSEFFLENQIGIEKINIYGVPEEKQKPIIEALLATGVVDMTDGAGRDIQIFPKRLNRKEALEVLFDRLGIGYENVMALGDSLLDAPVIEKAAIGVAMGNSPDCVKEKAFFVAAPYYEDGVGQAIEKFILNDAHVVNSGPARITSFSEYTPKHSHMVCFDSDGCVFDTMEIKHKECFCPVTVQVWGLQPIAKYVREAWEYSNLYSRDRGRSRFHEIVLVFDLLQERDELRQIGFQLPDITPLREWVKTAPILNNDDLARHAANPVMRQTLEWSLEMNRRAAEMVHGIPPYPVVRECLERLKDRADIIIVSATPREALLREWQEHDLMRYVHMLCAQEDGSKKECIGALRKHYDLNNILMIGDAPGDYEAAKSNGVSYYPIIPGQELSSWQTFAKEGLERFLEGTFRGEYEQSLYNRFIGYLPQVPPWKKD